MLQVGLGSIESFQLFADATSAAKQSHQARQKMVYDQTRGSPEKSDFCGNTAN
jgi:hypothetical protein